MHSDRRALIELHTAVLLFGVSGLFGKLLDLESSQIVLSRTLLGAGAILLWLIFSGQLKRAFSHQWLSNILLGSLLGLHWITFFHAIQVSTVAIGLLAFSSFPVFVTILEPLMYKEPWRRVDMLTSGAVVVGLYLIVSTSDLAGEAVSNGMIWGIVSAFLFAVLSLINRKRVQTTDSLSLTFLQNVGAAITAFMIMPDTDASVLMEQWHFLLILGVFCTTLPHMLMINSLRYLRTQLVSISICLEPVYGILFAALFLTEIPALSTLLGGAVIIGAIIIGTYLKDP